MDAVLGTQIRPHNQRRLQNALRSARLSAVKALTDSHFTFQHGVKREQLYMLHTLGLLDRKANTVFLGPPCVGKTQIAIYLAVAAAEYGRRVYNVTLADLNTTLEESQ